MGASTQKESSLSDSCPNTKKSVISLAMLPMTFQIWSRLCVLCGVLSPDLVTRDRHGTPIPFCQGSRKHTLQAACIPQSSKSSYIHHLSFPPASFCPVSYGSTTRTSGGQKSPFRTFCIASVPVGRRTFSLPSRLRSPLHQWVRKQCGHCEFSNP